MTPVVPWSKLAAIFFVVYAVTVCATLAPAGRRTASAHASAHAPARYASRPVAVDTRDV